MSQTVIQTKENDNLKIEVIQYEKLNGSKNIKSAQNVFYANHAGIKMKFVKMTLKNTEIQIEPGLLHYMKGNLEIDSGMSTGKGLKGFGKSLFKKFTTGETMFTTKIKGTGEVYLEPSFAHYILMDFKNNALIADKGSFYAGSAGVSVDPVMQKNISSALFGGEGIFQTKVSGTGIAVFCSPVPVNEIVTMELNNEKLFVDGNFTLFRTEGLEFKAEKSAKGWLGTLTSGELLLQTFSGTGKVWMAPSQTIYDELEIMDRADLSDSSGSSNGSTLEAESPLSGNPAEKLMGGAVSGLAGGAVAGMMGGGNVMDAAKNMLGGGNAMDAAKGMLGGGVGDMLGAGKRMLGGNTGGVSQSDHQRNSYQSVAMDENFEEEIDMDEDFEEESMEEELMEDDFEEEAEEDDFEEEAEEDDFEEEAEEDDFEEEAEEDEEDFEEEEFEEEFEEDEEDF